ncbi:MAG: stage V sporulation T C-terminal domain-containing protein [Clostridia bacterium]
MKEIGIVRRIDDLGRIVIPKELRKVIKLKEGDQIEIFANDKTLTLKKFNELNGEEIVVDKLCKCLASSTGKAVAFCNRQEIICAHNLGDELVGKAITPKLFKTLDFRKPQYLINNAIEIVAGLPAPTSQYISPVLSHGDLFGGMIIFGKSLAEKDILMCDLIVKFLVEFFE